MVKLNLKHILTFLSCRFSCYLLVIICSAVNVVIVESALHSGVDYVKVEKALLNHFAQTTERMKIIVPILRRYQRKFFEEYSMIKNRSTYTSNLLNLFSLSRRLTKDWPLVVRLLKSIPDHKTHGKNGQNLTLPEQVVSLWNSALTGLVRLQEVFNISSEIMINGSMEGTQTGNLSGVDCFDIGLYYYRLQHYARAVEWLLAALQTAEDSTLSRHLVLEYLHLAYCFKGDQEKFKEIQKVIQTEFLSFTPSKELLSNHTTATNYECIKVAGSVRSTLYDDMDAPQYVNYSALCKQKVRPPADKQLRCRLIHYNHHHLRISPFKMEELYLDPPLLMFYDVISDIEINRMMEYHYNKTKPSIVDYSEDTDVYADTQNNAWLDPADPYFPLSRQIHLRTARMTNMKLHHYDDFMIASYGVGGEIKPHLDLGAEDFEFEDMKTRADYVSVTYYLNEVQEGGQTIFPFVKQAVAPVKGAALLWFNRNPDWSANIDMMHSGCPILRGTKWIVTKWLHILAQDFPRCIPGKQKSFKYYYL